MNQSNCSTGHSGALMMLSGPTVSVHPEEGAILAAANIDHVKLRLARISAALDFLRVFRAANPLAQDPALDFQQRYLSTLHSNQQQAEYDARHYVIATSRREASTGGMPEWQIYMERLVFYRQLGMKLSRAQPDCWRDDILEHVETMLPHHGQQGTAPYPCATDYEDGWAAGSSDSSMANLSPASATHLLLFEENQAALLKDYDTPSLSNEYAAVSSNGYDTDPGTPYISEPGTETDSVSSGPMSPTDDFVHQELPSGLKASPPASLFNYQANPSVQIFHRQFLAPADAPKSKPFSYEDIYSLYETFDKTGIEYYIFERKRDSLHQMEVKSCQKVDLLRPFVEISRRFPRPSTHTQIPLEILLRMSRVIVNSFAWPMPGETWRQFLGARTERYRMEKEELDARTAPGLRRAEHADFCYSFMMTVTEYIGSNPALLDSVIDGTRLRENEKWDYVLAYRCIWENLGLIPYVSPSKLNSGLLLSAPHSRPRPRPRLAATHNEGISKLLGTSHAARPARRLA